MAIIVICDAGPLIHLDELECVDLLNDFDRVLIPDSVWQEVSLHRPQALIAASVRYERHKERTPLHPEIEALSTAFTLHRGEIDALNLTKGYPGAMLLTDDTAARLAARALQISAHGTIGILLRAVRRQQLSRNQVIEILQAIHKRSTLFIKKDLLDEIIRQVKTNQ